MSRHVVVIGGGVIGVCAAYYLARTGTSVTLLERADLAAGSSYGNAGLVVPSHALPLAAPGVLWQGLKWMSDPESPFWIKPRLDPGLAAWLWRFQRHCTHAHVQRSLPVLRDLGEASLALYEELAGLPGLEFGFRRAGVLCAFRTAAGLEGGRHEAALLEAAGLGAKVLDTVSARSLEPGLAPDLAGALHFPGDALLTPDRFVHGLAGVAAAVGVRVRTHTEALGFERAGRRVVAVDTTRGPLTCDEVVLAAGAWSPGLGHALGLSLPVQPAKGYSVTYAAWPDGLRMPVLAGEARFAVTPMRAEHGDVVRLGGTLELAGLDLSIDRRRVAALVRAARQYVALPAGAPLIEIWRGLRPCTPDGLPLLGRPRAWDNVLVATGHAMIGMSLGPVTGRLVAQLVTGEPPALDVSALAPDRFR